METKANTGDLSPAEQVNRPSKCQWSSNLKESTISPHNHVKRTLEKGARSVLSDSILDHVGKTPMIRLNNFSAKLGLKCQLIGKCEYFNPGGSIKDRIAHRMVLEAERMGKIKPHDGYTIIEPTSGNTGIGLAMVSAVRGYRCIIVMPKKMSAEKESVLKALGAEIIRTPTEASYDDPDSHISVAYEKNAEIPKSIILNQYAAAGNPLAHYDTTGEEILEACEQQVDAVVMGAGTGGTVTGVGRKLKERVPDCKIVVADPVGSTLAEPQELNKLNDSNGFYEVEGIGYDFNPTVLDKTVVDKWYKTRDYECFLLARQLIRTEGLLVGGSSGAALFAALEYIKEMNYQLDETKKIVVVLPDGIRNYMSKFMDDGWLEERFPMLNGYH